MNKMDFLEGKVSLYGGDSREVLKQIPDNFFDAIVTDPPYGLLFMAKAWDSLDGAAFATEFWAQIYRVLKPGGHVVAFSGTRSYHRLAVAIEDSGFEIRDMLSWHYGSGFPKSHNVSKGLDKLLGAERSKVKTPMGPTGNKYKKGLGTIGRGCKMPPNSAIMSTTLTKPYLTKPSSGKATERRLNQQLSQSSSHASRYPKRPLPQMC